MFNIEICDMCGGIVTNCELERCKCYKKHCCGCSGYFGRDSSDKPQKINNGYKMTKNIEDIQNKRVFSKCPLCDNIKFSVVIDKRHEEEFKTILGDLDYVFYFK